MALERRWSAFRVTKNFIIGCAWLLDMDIRYGLEPTCMVPKQLSAGNGCGCFILSEFDNQPENASTVQLDVQIDWHTCEDKVQQDEHALSIDYTAKSFAWAFSDFVCVVLSQVRDPYLDCACRGQTISFDLTPFYLFLGEGWRLLYFHSQLLGTVYYDRFQLPTF